jgi:hypothetical protein
MFISNASELFAQSSSLRSDRSHLRAIHLAPV